MPRSSPQSSSGIEDHIRSRRPSCDHTNPEDRELFRIASQIAEHDSALTTTLIEISQKLKESSLVEESG